MRPVGDTAMPCSDNLLSLVINWSMHVEHASSCWTMGVSQHCRRLLPHSAFTFPYILWLIYWYGMHACMHICMMRACMCLYHVPLNIAIEPRCSKTSENCCQQWQIQDFPADGGEGGCQLQRCMWKAIIWPIFPKNCGKLKEFRPIIWHSLLITAWKWSSSLGSATEKRCCQFLHVWLCLQRLLLGK